MTDHETAPYRRARRAARVRLQLRLDQHERAAIEGAAKASGFVSPAAFIVALLHQQEQTASLIVAIERQMQGATEAAVTAAIARLGDRLAADLAALSAAVDERPTKTQMSGFLSVFQSKVKAP